jgi:hypothetical protein
VNGLLDQLEREARARAEGLEALGKLPHEFTARHYPLTVNEQREQRRLKAALHASTDVDTFVALCKGRPVPASRIDGRLIDYKHRIDDVLS